MKIQHQQNQETTNPETSEKKDEVTTEEKTEAKAEEKAEAKAEEKTEAKEEKAEEKKETKKESERRTKTRYSGQRGRHAMKFSCSRAIPIWLNCLHAFSWHNFASASSFDYGNSALQLSFAL